MSLSTARIAVLLQQQHDMIFIDAADDDEGSNRLDDVNIPIDRNGTTTAAAAADDDDDHRDIIDELWWCTESHQENRERFISTWISTHQKSNDSKAVAVMTYRVLIVEALRHLHSGRGRPLYTDTVDGNGDDDGDGNGDDGDNNGDVILSEIEMVVARKETKVLLDILASGGSQGTMRQLVSLLESDYPTRRAMCGFVWSDLGYIAYRCRTCALSPCMSLCKSCFEAGDHASHDFTMFKSFAGGCCDCGNAGVLRPDGFCPAHQPGTEHFRPDVPENLVAMVRGVYAGVLRFISILACIVHSVDSYSTDMFTSHQRVSNESLSESQRGVFRLVQLVSPASTWLMEAVCSADALREVFSAMLLDDKGVHWPPESYTTFKSVPEPLGLDIDALLRSEQLPISHEIDVPWEEPSQLRDFFCSCLHLDFCAPMVSVLLQVLADPDVKKPVARAVSRRYDALVLAMIKSAAPAPFVNRMVHLSVQLFSSADLAFSMVISPHERLLDRMLVSAHALCRRAVLDHTNLNSGPTIDGGHEVVQDKLYWPISSDITNVLTHPAVATYMLSHTNCMSLWYDILRFLECMYLQKRAIFDHVEYQPDSWDWAFGIEMEFASFALTQLLRLPITSNDSQNISHFASAACGALYALASLFSAHNMGPVPSFGPIRAWTTRLISDPHMIGRCSFHLPLHRYFVGFTSIVLRTRKCVTCAVNIGPALIARCDNSIHTSDGSMEDMPVFFETLMERPLQLQAVRSEIRCGMWRRNGETLIRQLHFYLSARFWDVGFDLDIHTLQICVLALSKADYFYSLLLSRFHVVPFLNGLGAPAAVAAFATGNMMDPNDNKTVSGLLEDALRVILFVLSHRTYAGFTPQQLLTQEIVSRLAIKNHTHSQLIDWVPPDLAQSDFFDSCVAEVANFEPPVAQPSGEMRQGVYSIRPDAWARFDPVHVLLRSPSMLDGLRATSRYYAMAPVNERRASDLGCVIVPIPGDMTPPPVLTSCVDVDSGSYQNRDHKTINENNEMTSAARFPSSTTQSACSRPPFRPLALIDPAFATLPGKLLNSRCLHVIIWCVLFRSYRCRISKGDVTDATIVSEAATFLALHLLDLAISAAVRPVKVIDSVIDGSSRCSVHPNETSETINETTSTEADDNPLESAFAIRFPSESVVRNARHAVLVSGETEPQSLITLLLNLSRQNDMAQQRSYINAILGRLQIDPENRAIVAAMARGVSTVDEEIMELQRKRLRAKKRQERLLEQFAQQQNRFLEQHAIDKTTGESLTDGGRGAGEHLGSNESIPPLNLNELLDADGTEPEVIVADGHCCNVDIGESVVNSSTKMGIEAEDDVCVICFSSAPLPVKSYADSTDDEEDDVTAEDIDSKELSSTVLLPGLITWQQPSRVLAWACSYSSDGMAGNFVRTCGHHVHQRCFRAYFRTLNQSEAAPQVDIALGEFQCPLCRSLSNHVLPATPRNHFKASTNKYPFISFEDWSAACTDSFSTFGNDDDFCSEPDVTRIISSVLNKHLLEKCTTLPTWRTLLWDVQMNIELEALDSVNNHKTTANRHAGAFVRSILFQLSSLGNGDGHFDTKVLFSNLCTLHGDLLLMDQLHVLVNILAGWGIPIVTLTDLRMLVRAIIPWLMLQAAMVVAVNLPADRRAIIINYKDDGNNGNVCWLGQRLLNVACSTVQNTKECVLFSNVVRVMPSKDCHSDLGKQRLAAITVVEDHAGAWTEMCRLCLPFLRCVGVLSYFLFDEVPSPATVTMEAVANPVEHTMEEFSKWIGIHDVTWNNDIIEALSTRLHAAFVDGTLTDKFTLDPHVACADALPPLRIMATPTLLLLPYVYDDVLRLYRAKTCRSCNSVPAMPALCLVCNTLVCFAGRCCSTSHPRIGSYVGECTVHASHCGCGTGIFLLVETTMIIIMEGPRRGYVWGSLWLDTFGEEDLDLKRGKPLYLDAGRVAALTRQWTSHTLMSHSSGRRWTDPDGQW